MDKITELHDIVNNVKYRRCPDTGVLQVKDQRTIFATWKNTTPAFAVQTYVVTERWETLRSLASLMLQPFTPPVRYREVSLKDCGIAFLDAHRYRVVDGKLEYHIDAASGWTRSVASSLLDGTPWIVSRLLSCGKYALARDILNLFVNPTLAEGENNA